MRHNVGRALNIETLIQMTSKEVNFGSLVTELFHVSHDNLIAIHLFLNKGYSMDDIIYVGLSMSMSVHDISLSNAGYSLFTNSSH